MVFKAGKKRASPGADVEKKPLSDVELSDDDARKLQDIQRDIQRVELLLERRAQQDLVPVYQKRRAVAKSIPKYWPIALMNHSMFGFHAQHHIDQVALSYLEDVWVSRDLTESRCYTVEFYFKENPYFSDSVLKKEFKYCPPPAAANETPDTNGITPSMLDFSWERDVQSTATKINWKDPANALTKLHPRISDEDEEDDMPAESGSFFNFFELDTDPFEIGVLIANEIFPEATDYFLGTMGGDDLDSEEEDIDDDDDDEDAEEIDLEKPKSKKQKN